MNIFVFWATFGGKMDVAIMRAPNHSHQTLKKAVRGKKLDVYEGYLRGILGWL